VVAGKRTNSGQCCFTMQQREGLRWANCNAKAATVTSLLVNNDFGTFFHFIFPRFFIKPLFNCVVIDGQRKIGGRKCR